MTPAATEHAIPSLDELYRITAEPIEVDISRPKIDRAGIYAALRVAELWRFDGDTEQVIIERLGDDGCYRQVDVSRFLPIRAEEIRRWVVDENSDDQAAWAERLHAWVRADLAARPIPRQI
jgi:hypothetical protein